MRQTFSTMMLCATLVAAPVLAADPAAAPNAAETLVASLKPQAGKITLPGGIATLDLPPGFRYLDPKDAGRLLSEGWGNPPSPPTLGMIVPTEVSPMSAEGWGVVITYDKDGHVKDDDAKSIRYDELLKDMQESMADGNKQRKEAGYPAMALVGWAEQPHYDPATHKLYWAQQLRVDGGKGDSLNYNIRVLGREGVLILNAVAGMDQLATIKNEMKQVTAFTDFTSGNRYADFNESTDKVAEYGIAALIAGGAAAKLGLFGKLFALLMAFKKLIAIGVIALGSLLFKRWRNKDSGSQPAVDLSKH